MTGLSLRMSRLRKLLNIRIGPGAAIFPPNLRSVRLEFAQKTVEGHLAARRIWRDYLPRMKYHNPRLTFTVNRSTDQTGPSIMTLCYEDGLTETIDMKDKKESDLLRHMLELTKATPISATVEEEAELKRIAEQEIKSEEQRVQTRLKREEQDREERLLAQARGQVVDSPS